MYNRENAAFSEISPTNVYKKKTEENLFGFKTLEKKNL